MVKEELRRSLILSINVFLVMEFFFLKDVIFLFVRSYGVANPIVWLTIASLALLLFALFRSLYQVEMSVKQYRVNAIAAFAGVLLAFATFLVPAIIHQGG